MRFIRAFAVVFFLGLAACGGGGGSSYSADAIVAQMPSGTIAGGSWTAMSTVVRASGEDLSVTLYPVAVDACDSFASSDTSVIFSVPRMEGEYPLDLSLANLADARTVTFVTGPGENTISSEGIVVIEALSETEVTVGLIAEAGGHSINGRFTTAICHES